MKSSGRVMPALRISVAVNAVIVTGTSWMFSARWRAVTTTSSSWPARLLRLKDRRYREQRSAVRGRKCEQA